MIIWRDRMHAPGCRRLGRLRLGRLRPGCLSLGRIGGALLLLVMATVTWPMGVVAQDAEETKVILERMSRLERDIRSLNLSLARGVPAPAAKPVASPGASPAESPKAGGAAALVPVGGAGGFALVRLNDRLSSLENDLRSATGSIEEFTFKLGGLAKRFDKLVADVDYRLSVLEGRSGGTSAAQPRPRGGPRISAAPAPPPVQKIIPGQGGSFAVMPGNLGTVSQSAVGSVSPPSGGDKTGKPASATAAANPSSMAAAGAARPVQAAPAPAPAPVAANVPGVLPKGTPKEQYNFAFGLLRQANYDKAEIALKEFVRLHPKKKLASNARYWLGETYYVRTAYVQAAEVFLEGYQSDPKGTKAPDSLLKLGMSLSGLDKKREACAAFDKLIKDYPGVSAELRNKVDREKQKNSCS